MDQLQKKAAEMQREYARQWREANRERYNQKQREWRQNNPDKVKAAKQRYWERKALELLEVK